MNYLRESIAAAVTLWLAGRPACEQMTAAEEIQDEVDALVQRSGEVWRAAQCDAEQLDHLQERG